MSQNTDRGAATTASSPSAFGETTPDLPDNLGVGHPPTPATQPYASPYETLLPSCGLGGYDLNILVQLTDEMAFSTCPVQKQEALRLVLPDRTTIYVPLVSLPHTLILRAAERADDPEGIFARFWNKNFREDDGEAMGGVAVKLPTPPIPRQGGNAATPPTPTNETTLDPQVISNHLRRFCNLTLPNGKVVTEYLVVCSIRGGLPVVYTLDGFYTYAEIRAVTPLKPREVEQEMARRDLHGKGELVRSTFDVFAPFRRQAVVFTINGLTNYGANRAGFITSDETPMGLFCTHDSREHEYNRVTFMALEQEIDALASV